MQSSCWIGTCTTQLWRWLKPVIFSNNARRSLVAIALIHDAVAHVFATHPPLSLEVYWNTLAALHDYCGQLFEGWGQTKIVEDRLNKLRDREERYVRNRTSSALTQVAYMVDSQGIQLH